MAVNIDFVVLRECQKTIVAASEWMANEISELLSTRGDIPPHLSEVERLVVTLRHTGREFLNSEIVALKEVALSQRGLGNHSGQDPQLLVRRILNGLHASVAPVNGMIGALRVTESNTRLCTLLQSRMVGVFQAIDGIGDELRPLLIKDGDQQVARKDFGVYDPATD